MNDLKKTDWSSAKIIAWCFYDFGCSSFSTVVITFVIATYYTKAVAPNEIVGTSSWGLAIGFAGFLIALLSPFIGAITDQSQKRRTWFIASNLICIGTTALIWFAKPELQYGTYLLILVIIGTIFFELASVFYNAILQAIVPSTYLGRVSGWAWGLGYLGGLLCLLIALLLVRNEFPFVLLDTDAGENIRITAPLAAAWFFVFALPSFFLLKDQKQERTFLGSAIQLGYIQLLTNLKNIRQYKQIMLFLFARLFYIEGLNTIFAFGGIYAAGTFGFSFDEIMLFGIATNVTGGIGAASFAWLDDFIGSKKTILLSLMILIATTTGLLFATDKVWFWILGSILGICVGPIQAASRSFMVRLSPEGQINQMFGFFALSGRAASFLGPWLFAYATHLFQNQRAGVFTVLMFLICGFLFLCFVNQKANKKIFSDNL